MIVYLTSTPYGHYRDRSIPSYRGFNPENGFTGQLLKDWKENSRCLLISAFPDGYDINDDMKCFFEGKLKETGLSIASFDLCDRRRPELAEKAKEYDLILLGGGHVPTENAFFAELGLKKALEGFEGIVMGVSAGSMNCADTVYAQPEEPGEENGKKEDRFLPGLSLTKISVLPHYQAVKDDRLGEKRIFEDLTYPDSFGRYFYAIPDGSYIRQENAIPVLYGEGYCIHDGMLTKICEAGGSCRI